MLFTDTQNCSDTTQPVNAWGVGLVQRELVKAVKNDPAVIALGLAEAWLCGSPENVRQLLGWAAKTSTRNGLAVVARHGFAGPDAWQQLDTSRNPNPKDTMWVVRVPVCADASAARPSLFTRPTGSPQDPTNWLPTTGRRSRPWIHGADGCSAPHVQIGDLNVWEGVGQCGQQPNTTGIPKLRAAGYIDAWPRIHGGTEGFTGMTNRKGCGSPAGSAWKRIDYAWSSPRLVPTGITRFAVPQIPGEATASDHYGIIATYPMPGGSAPPGSGKHH